MKVLNTEKKYAADELEYQDELTLRGISELVVNMEHVAFSLVRRGKRSAALNLFSSVAALQNIAVDP